MCKKMFISFLLLILGATSLRTLPVRFARAESSATIQVNTTDDELNDDGDCSLREAIRAANLDSVVSACTAGSGQDTIFIPAGTYNLTRVGTDDTGQLGDLDLTGTVTLQGASSTTTIINGGGGGGGGIGDRVIDILSGATVTLSKMTIQGGVDNGFCGGGIRNQGTLHLSSVLIIANDSSSCGGGLYNTSSAKVTMNTTSFGNNQAHSGGAIFNEGELNAYKSAMSFDQATGGYGGGVNNDGKATFNEVTIAQETAGGDGGGIYNTGDLTITYSTIQDNISSSGDGGGVYGGWITMTHSTVYHNQATSGNGGGIYHNFHLLLTNVTLSANSAGGNGGGLFTNSNYDSTLTNVSLLGNSAANGSGIFRYASPGGSLQLKNTLLRNSLAGGNCSGTITSLGHNIDSGTTCGFNQTGDQSSTNPLTAALANNGGPTQTHALQSGSPAINAGDNTGCPVTDQRGFLRLGGCDIGAFEYLKWGYLPLVWKSP